MARMGAKPTRRRGMLLGEHMIDAPAIGREAQTIREPDSTYGYHLGALNIARTAFIATTNLPADWGDDAEEEAGE